MSNPRSEKIQLSSFLPFATVEECLAARKDNFLLLRLLAASLVIYRHAGAITGGSGFRDLIPWLGWDTDSGKLAVDIFFLVSGFMVTGSYLRRQNLVDFLWARALRIFPAYLVCLLLCSVALGAIYTNLSLASYFHRTETWLYITKNAQMTTQMAWRLPGVFLDNPKLQTINGSIWTLPAEVRMYLWVAVLGCCGLLANRWLGSAVILLLIILGIAQPDSRLLMLPNIYLHSASMFAIGALFYLNRKIIPVGWTIFAVLATATYLSRGTGIYPTLFSIALAQFCFSFAYRTHWYGYNRFGDYSYGVYIWGFPAQQLVAHHFPTLSPIGNALVAFPPSMALAVFSWHAIEQPALKLKSLPGIISSRWKISAPEP